MSLLGVEAMRNMEFAGGGGNRQQSPMPVQIGQAWGTESNDVAQMRNARQAAIYRYRTGESSHRQAVGVQQSRTPAAEDFGQLLAEPVLSDTRPIGRLAFENGDQLDAARVVNSAASGPSSWGQSASVC